MVAVGATGAGTKRLIVDLDGTLTVETASRDYASREPRHDVVERLRWYRKQGFEIVIQTARSMRTFAGAVGRINVETLPIVLDWLTRHDIPFDEVIVGKPWCGTEGFYIDDRAIRPDEFVKLTPTEIATLVGAKSDEQ